MIFIKLYPGLKGQKQDLPQYKNFPLKLLKNKTEKAFSLIEILWGVVLLSIIIVTVAGMFTGIFMSFRKIDKLTVAANLAEKQMEHIKLMSSTDILMGTWDGKTQMGTDNGHGGYFPPYPGTQPTLLKEKVDGVTYYFKTATSYVSGTNNNVISIVITVYWDAQENEGKNSFTMELYKAK